MEPPDGYVIQVGDAIEQRLYDVDRKVFKVTRVTKTMAICQISDRVELRFPRVYGFGFTRIPYQRTNVTYRPIPAEPPKEGE